MKHSKHQNHVRITGGQWRGRKIHFPNAQDLRPTPEMVREQLFNWLGQDLTGQAVLDVFSGSGVLALEALSRYAKSAVLCEKNRQTAQQLAAIVRELSVQSGVKIVAQDSLQWLKNHEQTYDLIFLDPPFSWVDWAQLFELIKKNLNMGAYVYVEAARLPEIPQWLAIHRQGKAGKSQYALLHYLGT